MSSSENLDQVKIEYHENMQDRIRDRKDSLKAMDIRESTKSAKHYSSEKVQKKVVRKKQQKFRSLQRQRSIQSELSDGSDVKAAPPKVSDSQVVAQSDLTTLQGEEVKEKNLDSLTSATISKPVVQREQRELKSSGRYSRTEQFGAKR